MTPRAYRVWSWHVSHYSPAVRAVLRRNARRWRQLGFPWATGPLEGKATRGRW